MAIRRFAFYILNSLLLLIVALSPMAAAAQTAPAGKVVLVLPFDNRSGNPSLSWIGDSFPDTLDKRLNSAGFLTISHDDRVYAFNHLGLPPNFRPSRATTIRIAQQLDADYVIVGSYNVQPAANAPPETATAAPTQGTAGATADRIAIQAQVLSVDELRLSPPVEDSAELGRLYDAENAIAWKVARVIEPSFAVAEQTFLGAGGAVPLPAFEDYIRGINAPTAAERIQRLKEAVAEVPVYPAALLALGKEQYAQRDYANAATTLAKVPLSDPLALEANFYLGMARFNSANYAGAEAAFAFLSGRLPLPEVVNNEAVAMSRQGKDAVALYARAATADPSEEDYHYNLAIALYRRGDTTEALQQADAALKLKPHDSEGGELRAQLSLAVPGTKLSSNPSSGFSPVERIRRTYSEASFRQAAFQLDQLRAARLALLPPEKRADEYVHLGNDYLAQELLPEAEEQFRSALTASPNDALAYAGLAQIRERSGDAAGARTQAAASMKLTPNATALLVLARLDLAQNQLAASAAEVSRALQIDPSNTAAQGMRQALLQRGQHVP